MSANTYKQMSSYNFIISSLSFEDWLRIRPTLASFNKQSIEMNNIQVI